MSVEHVVCQTPSPGVDELQNQIRNLDAALQTARVIGQAQGLLMAQSRCGAGCVQPAGADVPTSEHQTSPSVPRLRFIHYMVVSVYARTTESVAGIDI